MVENPPWLELPEGIWANILHRLGAIKILETAEKVCSKWRRVGKDPSMWRVIDMWNLGDLPYNLKKMCRYAVDRSQGELVDINMEYFATDELLLYVAERSEKLRRLGIACCYGTVCEGLVETVQKLPLLEELSLTHTAITTEGIEALGRSCPHLNSFELNNSCYMGTGYYSDGEDGRNDEALAIAKNLPALHHLQLIGNNMTNEGLQAIVDGCPHLVSLDLRLCKNVCLNEILSSRIYRHIKDVKHPHDSMKGLTVGFEPWGDEIDEYNASSGDDIYGNYLGFSEDDIYNDYLDF